MRARRAVEVGCGSGFVTASLALLLRSARRRGDVLLATDVSPAALAATAETLRAHGVSVGARTCVRVCVCVRECERACVRACVWVWG